jgi:hypothetical protein
MLHTLSALAGVLAIWEVKKFKTPKEKMETVYRCARLNSIAGTFACFDVFLVSYFIIIDEWEKLVGAAVADKANADCPAGQVCLLMEAETRTGFNIIIATVILGHLLSIAFQAQVPVLEIKWYWTTRLVGILASTLGLGWCATDKIQEKVKAVFMPFSSRVAPSSAGDSG